MNLFEIVKYIENLSLNHPLINSFLTNQYKLNSENDITYPAIVLNIGEITKGSQVDGINVTMMYVDRLTSERINSLEVQSAGVDTLAEIANAINHYTDYLNIADVDNNSLSINIFDGQFADLTAGAIATYTIVIPSNISDCIYFDGEPPCNTCYER